MACWVLVEYNHAVIKWNSFSDRKTASKSKQHFAPLQKSTYYEQCQCHNYQTYHKERE